MGLAITPPGLPRLAHHARADASHSAPLARRSRRRGSTAVSFASPVMAATPLVRTCPIRIISVHLLDAAGRLLRVLFLDHQAARLATSQWPHQRRAALRATGRGPDPCLQSAAGAWAPGQGSGAVMRLAGGGFASGLPPLVSMPTNPVSDYQKHTGLGINRTIAAAHARLRHQRNHRGGVICCSRRQGPEPRGRDCWIADAHPCFRSVWPAAWWHS